MITRVLVTVMTYPTLSKNHFETVCTAGFREDGSWIATFLIQIDSQNFSTPEESLITITANNSGS